MMLPAYFPEKLRCKSGCLRICFLRISGKIRNTQIVAIKKRFPSLLVFLIQIKYIGRQLHHMRIVIQIIIVFHNIPQTIGCLLNLSAS